MLPADPRSVVERKPLGDLQDESIAARCIQIPSYSRFTSGCLLGRPCMTRSHAGRRRNEDLAHNMYSAFHSPSGEHGRAVRPLDDPSPCPSWVRLLLGLYSRPRALSPLPRAPSFLVGAPPPGRACPLPTPLLSRAGAPKGCQGPASRHSRSEGTEICINMYQLYSCTEKVCVCGEGEAGIDMILQDTGSVLQEVVLNLILEPVLDRRVCSTGIPRFCGKTEYGYSANH